MDFFENVVKEKVIYGNQEILKDKEAFNIAFGIDKNYAMGMGVLMYSLSVNCKNRQVYHIFTDELYIRDLNRVKNFCSNNVDVCVVIYMISNEPFKSLPTANGWTQAIYYRFLIDKSIHPLPEKILYLDSDMLCINDIEELFKMNTNRVVSVGADVPYMQRYAEKKLNFKEDVYFNSGMLMIDVDKWKSINIFDKVVKLLHDSNYEFFDQDALNVILKDEKNIVNEKYNFILDDDKKVFSDKIIIHMVGNYKPWHRWGEARPITKIWLQYKNKSCWNDEPIVEPKTYKQAKLLSKSYRERGMVFKRVQWLAIYSLWKILEKLKLKH